jgi:predicted MPP superfamily phosphohydrolase
LIKKNHVFSFLVLLLFLNSFVFERYFTEFKEYPIEFENLPDEFDGFKILQISDLHFGFLNPEFYIQYIIDRSNDYGADIIVGTGDYVKKKKSNTETEIVWNYLNQLNAKHGVYFVLGNHDHWANTNFALKKLNESKFSLRHKGKILEKRNSKIAIIGAGDFWEDEYGIEKILENLPKDMFRIVLAHNPESSDFATKHRVDLFISGHTHGGQIIIPFINYAPLLPVKNKKYSFGIKTNSVNQKVFISKGVGWSIIPFRFNCRSEIPIIVLRKKS